MGYLGKGPGIRTVLLLRHKSGRLYYVRTLLIAHPLHISCALYLVHAMGLVQHEATIEHVVDLAITVQTVRSCLFATERDPRFTAAGYCVPNPSHLAVGGIAMLQARQRMAEILRIVPGSSLVVAPSDHDLAAPEVAVGLADAFGGGGYTAVQRAALLQLAWDH